MHSMFDVATPEAASIVRLFWVLTAVCAAVFVAVVVWLGAAVRRGLRRELPDTSAVSEARAAVGVTMATGLTVVVLFVFLVLTLTTGRALSRTDTRDALTIDVVGHQWWWEVSYPDARPDRIVVTANELHVPVGRPVTLRTTSHDVIHSFWAPSLHGKKDLIPGHVTATTFRVEHEGTFRGQCAEFCGYQHAHMALEVVAEPPQQFEAWLQAQRDRKSTRLNSSHP